MPNPTRQEIVAAHEALEELEYAAWNLVKDWDGTELPTQWRKQILAVLPPKPAPTMAEIEWDDRTHYLAEAKRDDGSKVIMLGEEPDGTISVFDPRPVEYRGGTVIPNYLTPTGRKFTLTEAK